MMRLDLDAAASALLVIDVQERFLKVVPSIAADQPCGRNCRILLQAAGLLGIPRLISEQYPAGLGPTLPQFLTPEVLGVLVEKFDIRPTSEAREDLDRMLQAA